MTLRDRVAGIDWAAVAAELDTQGWAVLPGLIADPECDAMTGMYGGEGWPSRRGGRSQYCRSHFSGMVFSPARRLSP